MVQQIFYAFTMLPPAYILGSPLEFGIDVKGKKEPFEMDVSLTPGEALLRRRITEIEEAPEFSVDIGEGELASRITFRARDNLVSWARQFELEEGLPKGEIGEFACKVVYPLAMTDLNLFIDALRQAFDDPYFERLGTQLPVIIVTVTPLGEPISVIVVRGYPWQEEGLILSATLKDVPRDVPTPVTLFRSPHAWKVHSGHLKQIQEICAGQSPQVWNRILLDARSALHSGNYREALLNSHTSIESRLYDLADRALKARDVKKEVRQIVHRAPFEKQMGEVLKSLYGRGFKGGTGRDCKWLYDTRNAVIHRGISVSHADAEKAIQVARAALRFLDSLQQSAAESLA